ncbi:MAG: hypothetical protein ACXADA_18265 [Candidatus Hodarchaeales archaeon]|jgi:hypothetical protein
MINHKTTTNNKQLNIKIHLPRGFGLHLKISRSSVYGKEKSLKDNRRLIKSSKNLHKAQVEHLVHILGMYR